MNKFWIVIAQQQFRKKIWNPQRNYIKSTDWIYYTSKTNTIFDDTVTLRPVSTKELNLTGWVLTFPLCCCHRQTISHALLCTVHSFTLYVFGTYSTQLFNEDRKKTDKIKITILKHQFFSTVCIFISTVLHLDISQLHHTVRPMNHMCLTSLQKCNRAWWQMLFHPKALTLVLKSSNFWTDTPFLCLLCFTRVKCDSDNSLVTSLLVHSTFPLNAIHHPDWSGEPLRPQPLSFLK
jgi:hypothetical protein